jgi:hypothetical protein
MTLVADAKKRVVLPCAKPGDRFDVQVEGDGKIVLRRLAPVNPVPAKVRVERRGGFSIGILGKPIDDHALKEALAEFP